jgi:class 3 adenylate cyclase
MYKERFENVFRLAQELTRSLDIGEVLETIRDQARSTIPNLQEVCLLVLDPEAQFYARPLHCAMEAGRINCQLCKRGRRTIDATLSQEATSLCFLPERAEGRPFDEHDFPDGLSEIVLPIYSEGKPLAVLDAIAKPSTTLGLQDALMLKDLSALASNVIKNARSHWKVGQQNLTVNRILEHLRPFVPATVQKIVDKDPEAPSLEKRDLDVSILFLDVAGYTKISETHTREKVNFIIEKYFSSFLDIISSHDGDINETAGDGLMAIFQGAPAENALSAVTSALEIRERTFAINRELRNRFLPVAVNMGINSGTASVGMTRFQGTSGTRMTYTATGPVTNLAARIAAAAKNGDILLGPETADRVQSHVALFDRGPMQFKNVKNPVRVFSVVRSGEHELEGGKREAS